MGVGTATGHIQLYDIRCNKPFQVKHHDDELIIKDINFHHQEELIYSMDKTKVNIWDKRSVSLQLIYKSIISTDY